MSSVKHCNADDAHSHTNKQTAWGTTADNILIYLITIGKIIYE